MIRNNDFQDIKREKTIILSTNSVGTAELLADRIAIIVNGRIECYGTKMYLNHRYGKIQEGIKGINQCPYLNILKIT